MKMRWMVAVLILAPGPSAAQVQADPALLTEIRQIRAVDNHAHIPPFALSVEPAASRDPLGVAEFPYPVRLRVDSPEWAGAWRAFYGAPVTDPAGVLRRKDQLIREQGEGHIAWVLDRVGIDIALNNAPALGPGQSARDSSGYLLPTRCCIRSGAVQAPPPARRIGLPRSTRTRPSSPPGSAPGSRKARSR